MQKLEIESESMGLFSSAIGESGRFMPPRLNIEPEKVENGLVKLVLALVELIRRLLERQAIRRMEGGGLSEEEIDRLGITLMRLEQKMGELTRQFKIEDLNIYLGPLGRLLD